MVVTGGEIDEERIEWRELEGVNGGERGGGDHILQE